MKLLPRDARFFELLRSHTKRVVQAARVLRDGVSGGPASLPTAAIHIEQLEQQADGIVHDVLVRLNRSILAPLDPEDIHALASRLDDVLDGIEDCSYRLSAYRIACIPEKAVELCQIIVLASVQVEEAIRVLSAGKDVSPQCMEINRLENVADEIVRSSIEELMTGEGDAIERLKLKEIYEFLENTVDRC
jgi:uncharacterized protein Yka (UPF0111/DUF47 family)